jgi:hypothetical protein
MPLQAADLLAHFVALITIPSRANDRARNSSAFTALGAIAALITVNQTQMQYWRDRVEKGIPL